jgi:hypothetical protein
MSIYSLLVARLTPKLLAALVAPHRLSLESFSHHVPSLHFDHSFDIVAALPHATATRYPGRRSFVHQSWLSRQT